MKKILITGASGFLGLPITKNLADSGEYQVYAVISGLRQIFFPDNVQSIAADLLNREESARIIEDIRPDIMIHLAWDTTAANYMHSESNIVWLEESLYLLRKFAECKGGGYFMFAGSSAEYNRSQGLSETGDSLPASLYGRCKNNFHNIAVKFCENRNIDYTNLRFFPTLGKEMGANAGAPIAAATSFHEGLPFECKAPYNVWDFIGIDDAAQAACAVIKKRHIGAINIGSGIPRLMSDVFELIAKKMNAEHLLRLNFENTSKEILVANTDILNNSIGYTCAMEFEKMIDEVIAGVRERFNKL